MTEITYGDLDYLFWKYSIIIIIVLFILTIIWMFFISSLKFEINYKKIDGYKLTYNSKGDH
ncbi:hypothetical protein [Acanthamoeba castellanii mimivirus]|uniref:Uncharacterized protein n=2 Tax=Mimivirus TaxID=315393 RepID=E3VZQ5_MIMIV|nr:hypothetical protein MIMI_gp0729 [Acanthamoeba polyphaga mimivirus]AEQ60884.1 putative membrane protein [Acanthamoeba castellanii mamavirus]AHA45161.1 hypothetical protein HIRU_S255 [Hirudovirus strain Sangsue]QTF49612.1 hypothetical protein [Mimivirus reunion]WMV62055.1 hypothetical protein qu_721 [Mimivirus sp.]BAV61803.1 hypothetical protein [Acanthamoeba castellanii mimivirus]